MTLRTPCSRKHVSISDNDIPVIDSTDRFDDVVIKIKSYITRAIDVAYTYEQLRTTITGCSLRSLVVHLSENCFHPALLPAILACAYVFRQQNDDDIVLRESRALACEVVGWELLMFLSEREVMDALLYDLSPSESASQPKSSAFLSRLSSRKPSNEESPLLPGEHSVHSNPHLPPIKPAVNLSRSATSLPFRDLDVEEANLSEEMAGLNALEIAAVANAKKFLCQRSAQKVIGDIWHGEIIFWSTLSLHAQKSPSVYNPHNNDIFSRLRVPKYQKAFQVGFFLVLLLLYYYVLIQRNPSSITLVEILLYIWLASFAYDELGEYQDAGRLFYQRDFWSIWDLAIIIVGIAFFITRIVGLVRGSEYVTDIAFDVLSMAALFLVPRICSVASLNPYFGSLLPVLKEMTTAFCKFLPVIAILYLGFLTTFTMLARDRLSLKEVSWLLIKVFFGSSYLGFDVAVQISPIFGYTLMVIFVALTNILLITALVSLVSNSLTEVMANAREEYLFQYSVYVLESCTSRRLTYFLPPTNLIPLLCVRPLRLFLPSEIVRKIRIILLRVVSLPFVALIWCYESSSRVIMHKTKLPRKSIRPRPASSKRASYGFYRNDAPGATEALRNSGPSGACRSEDPSVNSSITARQADLVRAIGQLSTQIEDLTAMVSERQV